MCVHCIRKTTDTELTTSNICADDMWWQSGDRIVEVDGQVCDDAPHQEVIRMIRAAGSPLRLRVVRDERMRVHAKKITKSLLGKGHTHVMNDRTNIPRTSQCPLHAL